MDTEIVREKVEDLAADIDVVEKSMNKLINLVQEALAGNTSKIPLLDTAKLYVHIVYAIESILFSYMRLHGVQAKEHPIFQELTRVRGYFAKIKAAEELSLAEGNAPGARLDKDATERVIKHGLSGNARYDQARHARETTGAKRKLESMGAGKHTRLDEGASKTKKPAQQQTVTVVKADDIETSDSDSG
jgi:exosome complex protein LRP1